MLEKVAAGRDYIGRLDHGDDLLEAITAFCREQNIKLGRIHALGAVQKARIGYYHQDRREYEFIELDRPLEILGLIGNVSLRDGEPMVHAHVTLGDADGSVCGGHLAPGTTVFACEVSIRELTGASLNRELDATTGLPLWTEMDE